MSFTDYTYYVRDINVPVNVNDSSTDAEKQRDGNYVRLNDSINRYENDVLKSLLGYALWKEFTDAYAASILEVDAVALPTKWSNFLNGAEFSFELNGQTISTKWNGLINSDKISLIANYVYFYHRLYSQTSNSGIGETKAKGENSVIADGSYKMVSAWNKMVNLYGEIPYETIKIKSFLDVDNYVHYNVSPSAYNFLLANKETYSNWVFTPLHKKHNYF